MKRLIFVLVACFGGGATAYALDGTHWHAGLIALAVYAMLLAADGLWARRHHASRAPRA